MRFVHTLLLISLSLSLFLYHAECRPLLTQQASHNAQGGLNKEGKVQTRLMIMFLSYAGDDRRMSLRDTWLQDAVNETKHIFVLGNIDQSPNKEAVLKEQEEYGDMIILNDVVDDYDHLSDKALKGFKEVHSRYVFDYLLKTDTDTFVLIPRLLKFLEAYPPVRRYIGEFAHSQDPNELWYGHLKGIYYMLGGGYLLSYDLVEYFAHSQHLMRRSRSEDVTVGIHLHSLEINMDAQEESLFKAGASSVCSCVSTIILNHKCKRSDMYYMYYSFQETGQMCEYLTNQKLAEDIVKEYSIQGDSEDLAIRWP